MLWIVRCVLVSPLTQENNPMILLLRHCVLHPRALLIGLIYLISMANREALLDKAYECGARRTESENFGCL